MRSASFITTFFTSLLLEGAMILIPCTMCETDVSNDLASNATTKAKTRKMAKWKLKWQDYPERIPSQFLETNVTREYIHHNGM
jgi:hypothetical protein